MSSPSSPVANKTANLSLALDRSSIGSAPARQHGECSDSQPLATLLLPHLLVAVSFLAVLFVDFLCYRHRSRIMLKHALDKQSLETLFPRRVVCGGVWRKALFTTGQQVLAGLPVENRHVLPGLPAENHQVSTGLLVESRQVLANSAENHQAFIGGLSVEGPQVLADVPAQSCLEEELCSRKPLEDDKLQSPRVLYSNAKPLLRIPRLLVTTRMVRQPDSFYGDLAAVAENVQRVSLIVENVSSDNATTNERLPVSASSLGPPFDNSTLTNHLQT